MSLGKNHIKRLCTVVGMKRVTPEISEHVSSLAENYLCTLLKQLLVLTLFLNKKTITVEIIQFLGSLCRDEQSLVVVSSLDKLTTVMISKSEVQVKEWYSIYAPKRSFEKRVRELLLEYSPNVEIRIGKNVPILLQYMVEKSVITLLNESQK